MRRRLALVLGCGLLGLYGCATAPVVQVEKTVASALVSPEQERQLGLQIHEELEKEGVRYVQDPVVEEYVRRIATPVLQVAAREAKDFEFHVHIIDDPDQVNAFATPGGHLYIYSGLLLNVQSEDALAGVIAHEAGHIAGRHAARNMVQLYGLNALASLAVGQDPSLLEQIAAQVVGTGAVLYHSRSQELEADMYGARFASSAGYAPGGLIQFLEQLMAEQGKTPAVLSWLSSHPTNERRIEELREYIAKQGLGGGSLNVGRLGEVQRRLRAQPRAGR